MFTTNLVVSCALLGVGTAQAQTLFSDDFDAIPTTTITSSGTNGGYWVRFNAPNNVENFTVIFGFDYATVTYPLTIPSAPNSSGGTTRGLYLTVNKNPAFPNGAANTLANGGTNSAVNLYPTNQSFSGNFSLKFDLWINWTNLNFSTEHVLFGINHSGMLTNRIAKSGSDGLFFAMDGDGGSSATSTTARDFSMFRGVTSGNPVLLGTNNTVFATPPLGNRFDNGDNGFSTLFPSKSITGYPTTPVGTPGLGWVAVEARYETNHVIWLLDNTIIADYNNTNVFTSGNIMIGYNDIFNSLGDINDFVIIDNIRVENIDAPPLVIVTNPIPTATEAGPVSGQFTLIRLGNTAGPLNVSYTVGGTATPGSDYATLPGTVTFAPGAAQTNILVTPVDDPDTESAETVTLTVTAGGGYVLGSTVAATTVIADNELPAISITSTQTLMLEGFGGQRIPCSMTRLGSTNSALTVNLAYAGTATFGNDFNGPANVALAAGAAVASFTLTPLNDAAFEGTETLIVNVAAGTGYDPGATPTINGTVSDDDLPSGVILFSDTFDYADTFTNWVVNPSSGDAFADFAFDYSTVGIPEAPSSAGTFAGQRGLKFRANETSASLTGLSASPLNGNYAGNYRLRFDLWLNQCGPLNLATVPGSTQSGSAGVGTTGVEAMWPGTAASEGVWFSATGDGRSSSGLGDFNAYTGATLFGDTSGAYTAGNIAGVRDNVNSHYLPWNGVTAPAAQITAYPSQTGTSPANAIGMNWHSVSITKRGVNVTWDIDGRRIVTVDATALPLSTNVFVGLHDPFVSVTTNAPMQFGLVDNVRVETLGRPTITHIEFINGGTQVQVDFIAEFEDTPGLFGLETSGAVSGTFTPVSATLTTLGGNQFRAVTGTGGATQFYKIRRL